MTEPRVVVIVQARMGSTRLPGKVLMDLGGRPMLERQIQRLRRARTPDAIVIATSTGSGDDPIVDLVNALGVPTYRGPENDVLARYAGAAASHRADVVVRVTGDCPLIDPGVLDRCVRHLLDDPELDYVSNALPRTFPRGLDVEVLTREALDTAHREATEAADREHVTRYVWRRPRHFRTAGVTDDDDHSHLRWTVDSLEDLEVVRAIYAALYPLNADFGYTDALRHAREHPTVHAVNAHVVQKQD